MGAVKKKNGRPLMLDGKRTRHIKARVTEEEYTLACKQWKSLSMNESDFLRLKVLDPNSVRLKVNPAELILSLDMLGNEIGRSGNNINQLARHANFLNKRGMLNTEIVVKFNELFSDYISVFREMEKGTRAMLRLLKA
ncbi:plasmid mobilization protein [Pedobacter aquatilis]|uniref:plasmid mobilization protein n=1 Tax=Pedobacter aquatilis TaxID=351343 RepID=UPI00292F82A8|nr:plasmid mobilization relaxosome protein MobC [Pedobacter aquatilis]